MRTMRFAVVLLATLAVTGCPKKEGSDTGTPGTDATNPGTDANNGIDSGPGTDANVNPCPGGMMAIDVMADITADTTWSACNVYTLKQHIFVENATLTIEAGTLIKGDQGSSLVITTSATIDAQGTAALPIVFTSSAATGARAEGDWGGLVLLGLATINPVGGTAQIEGFPPTETRVGYGGTDDTHNCGTLRYVRVEFAGFQLAPGNELNGISVGGCGSDTTFDFLEVHKGADDGMEMFGGTANVSHLLVSQPNDDGLDWDFGWSGEAQFIIVIQNSVEGNNGFEADDGPTDFDALPRSHPIIWNATLVGSDADPGMAGMQQLGMLLRRGTAGEMTNILMLHFADFPIDIRDMSTVNQTPADLFVHNGIFFDNGNMSTWVDATDNDNGFDEGMYFMTEPTNMIDVDPMLTDELNLAAPNFTPMAGSPALVAANAGTPPADGFLDTTATYIGAIGTTDWTAGWTAFPAN